MINLSYNYIQNSSSLKLNGMPDVSNGDTEQTLGILSSWTLKIIGAPLLEGEKHHLDNLLQVVLEYSRSYVLGIKKAYKSNNDVVSISPFGIKHKLLLNSSKSDVKPLTIILDDSELSDLTRCLDLVRFDPKINIKWSFNIEKPYSKYYLRRNIKNSKTNLNFIYALIVFIISSSLLIFIPINNKQIINETNSLTPQSSEEIN